jgi:glycosyltransferase involved in cell wall biosynthesis
MFMHRHWSINGRFLSRSMTGVDRYALEILRGVDAFIRDGHPLAAGLKLELLCPAGAVKASPFAEIPLQSLPGAPGHIWEQFILPGYVAGGLLSLCNTGPIAVKKQIVCIHDLNTRVAPDSYGFMFRAAYRFIQPALGRRAAKIVTVSRFSQNALARFGIRSADDVRVIHNGHEHVQDWNANRSQLNEANFPLPFVLLVGSNAPHKNVAIIYSIADELAAKGVNILVAGGGDKNVYARGQHQAPANVRHLGRVNDDDLALLYRRASGLVFPSKAEGFGLPALEAMALGCPVISSDAASLPEVCGDAALYAPPDDAAAWLAAIGRILNEPGLRQTLAGCGVARSKGFSWRQSAEKYLELMYAVDHGNRETGKIAQTQRG